ncbi:hypothetical protein N2W54_006117 [Lotmaria passim]
MLVEAATRIRLPLSRTLLSEVGAEGFERLVILALSDVIGPRVAFESPPAPGSTGAPRSSTPFPRHSTPAASAEAPKAGQLALPGHGHVDCCEGFAANSVRREKRCSA